MSCCRDPTVPTVDGRINAGGGAGLRSGTSRVSCVQATQYRTMRPITCGPGPRHHQTPRRCPSRTRDICGGSRGRTLSEIAAAEERTDREKTTSRRCRGSGATRSGQRTRRPLGHSMSGECQRDDRQSGLRGQELSRHRLSSRARNNSALARPTEDTPHSLHLGGLAPLGGAADLALLVGSRRQLRDEVAKKLEAILWKTPRDVRPRDRERRQREVSPHPRLPVPPRSATDTA